MAFKATSNLLLYGIVASLAVAFTAYNYLHDNSAPPLANEVSEKKAESKKVNLGEVENISDSKVEPPPAQPQPTMQPPIEYPEQVKQQVQPKPVARVKTVELEKPVAPQKPFTPKKRIPLPEPPTPLNQNTADLTPPYLNTNVTEPATVSESVNQKIIVDTQNPIYYARSPLFDISVGVGVDYSILRQNGNSNSTSGSFDSLAFPSTALAFKYRLNNALKLNLEYQIAPGEIKTIDLSPIDQNSYNRNSTIFEFEYIFSQNQNSRYSILTGFQSHEFPFLSENSNNQLNLLKNTFLNFSIGLGYSFLSLSNYEFDLFLRYQNMLTSQSLNGYDFKTHSGINFDGSLGVTKIYNSGLKLGLFWFGQQHTFSYDFLRDTNLCQGSQYFFDSNLQLRIGWNFNL